LSLYVFLWIFWGTPLASYRGVVTWKFYGCLLWFHTNTFSVLKFIPTYYGNGPPSWAFLGSGCKLVCFLHPAASNFLPSPLSGMAPSLAFCVPKNFWNLSCTLPFPLSLSSLQSC
jgi:hypothetical protein